MDTINQIQALGQRMMPKSDKGENLDSVSGSKVEMRQTAVKKPE